MPFLNMSNVGKTAAAAFIAASSFVTAVGYNVATSTPAFAQEDCSKLSGNNQNMCKLREVIKLREARQAAEEQTAKSEQQIAKDSQRIAKADQKIATADQQIASSNAALSCMDGVTAKADALKKKIGGPLNKKQKNEFKKMLLECNS